MRLLSRSEEIVLVAIWRLRGNAYGVTIRDLVSELTGYDWTLGAVYVPLDTLTRRAFVEKAASKPVASRGGRSKCLYVLTREGRNALREIREVQDVVWRGISRSAFDEK